MNKLWYAVIIIKWIFHNTLKLVKSTAKLVIFKPLEQWKSDIFLQLKSRSRYFQRNKKLLGYLNKLWPCMNKLWYAVIIIKWIFHNTLKLVKSTAKLAIFKPLEQWKSDIFLQLKSRSRYFQRNKKLLGYFFLLPKIGFIKNYKKQKLFEFFWQSEHYQKRFMRKN